MNEYMKAYGRIINVDCSHKNDTYVTLMNINAKLKGNLNGNMKTEQRLSPTTLIISERKFDYLQCWTWWTDPMVEKTGLGDSIDEIQK